jgi:uncharacterized protein YjbI with pentapeptide repeats
MLAACVYSWLTIASTNDVALITNSSTSPLPVIGTSIPIVGFYIAAPFLLLAVYVYFHINWLRLWEGLTDLPAFFHDGRRLDQVAFPWFLNGLVCAYFPLMRDQRPPLSRIQTFLSVILAWLFTPLTLFLLWRKYLPRHDWLIWFQIAPLMLTVGFCLWSFYLLHTLLSSKHVNTDRQSPAGNVVMLVACCFLFFFPPALTLQMMKLDFDPSQLPSPMVYLFPPCATLAEMDVSVKPIAWKGKEEDLELVKGALLRERYLQFAHASGAFLAKSDLRKANLRKADLTGADLRGANLTMANMQGAILTGADLRGAELLGANLQEANLERAQFQKAKLEWADLRKAILIGAFLSEANLLWSNLEDAKLEKATLKKTNLEEANCRRANLSGTLIEEAIIRGAYFEREKDLAVAIGLTEKQKNSAIIKFKEQDDK